MYTVHVCIPFSGYQAVVIIDKIHVLYMYTVHVCVDCVHMFLMFAVLFIIMSIIVVLKKPLEQLGRGSLVVPRTITSSTLH